MDLSPNHVLESISHCEQEFTWTNADCYVAANQGWVLCRSGFYKNRRFAIHVADERYRFIPSYVDRGFKCQEDAIWAVRSMAMQGNPTAVKVLNFLAVAAVLDMYDGHSRWGLKGFVADFPSWQIVLDETTRNLVFEALEK